MQKNVNSVVEKGKCCSCGVCVGVCPKQCISLKLDSKKQGMPSPSIDDSACVSCGMCLNVCGGLSKADYEVNTSFSDKLNDMYDNVIELKTGYYTDEKILAEATSGGICTGLIKALLDKGMYDVAFCVCTSNYSGIVKTEPVTSVDTLESTKSRYIPVSHEDTARYMIENPDKRVVLVGTSCALESLLNLIRVKKLNRENYLLLGLFCDKTMTYQVWNYFDNKNDQLEKMFFRTKEKDGWPGNFKLDYGRYSLTLNKSERMGVKDFFCHERCLYCTDKLNRLADISIGDNYTGENADKRGSSCIIVRTQRGKNAFDIIRDNCVLFDTSLELVEKSQEIKKKKENDSFAKSKFAGKKINGKKLLIKYYFKRLKIKSGYYAIKFPLFMKLMKILDKKVK